MTCARAERVRSACDADRFVAHTAEGWHSPVAASTHALWREALILDIVLVAAWALILFAAFFRALRRPRGTRAVALAVAVSVLSLACAWQLSKVRVATFGPTPLSSERESTRRALPAILSGLRARGLRSVTLSELMRGRSH
jgi:hypothetical protein